VKEGAAKPSLGFQEPQGQPQENEQAKANPIDDEQPGAAALQKLN
jgi:hypothetical protein